MSKKDLDRIKELENRNGDLVLVLFDILSAQISGTLDELDWNKAREILADAPQYDAANSVRVKWMEKKDGE